MSIQCIFNVITYPILYCQSLQWLWMYPWVGQWRSSAENSSKSDWSVLDLVCTMTDRIQINISRLLSPSSNSNFQNKSVNWLSLSFNILELLRFFLEPTKAVFCSELGFDPPIVLLSAFTVVRLSHPSAQQSPFFRSTFWLSTSSVLFLSIESSSFRIIAHQLISKWQPTSTLSPPPTASNQQIYSAPPTRLMPQQQQPTTLIAHPTAQSKNSHNNWRT